MLFHERFAALLAERFASDDLFAAKAGYTREAVGNWRRGTRVPGEKQFADICAALGLDAEGREDDRAAFEALWEDAVAERGKPGRKSSAAGSDESNIARPDRFIGRGAELAALIAALTAEGGTRALILGEGGMGKSTLTRQAATDAAVVARFGPRRFEVELAAMTGADAMLLALARAVGTDPAAGLPPIRAKLTSAPALLLLDNLESPWEADADAVEALLGKLAEAPGVALVASMRSKSAPRKPDWTHHAKLKELSRDEAKALFLRIARDIAEAIALLERAESAGNLRWAEALKARLQL